MTNKPISEETITSYLMDGDDQGRIKCSVKTSNLIFYKIPRNMLSLCENGQQDVVKHIKHYGIYFLLG
ncbi:hypothetical protein IKS57_02730 [bacterium]|nr:hypothetical protein [bacterium]